ncbi:MAG: hypothetical protein N2255_09260 [Kiritimatiellae bacterium]|nr:hypothetical protein [Kiritimatiellia bacterium]
MSKTVVFMILAGLVWTSPSDAADQQAPATKRKKDYGTYCGVWPQFRDNVTLTSDVERGNLRMDREGRLRIFVTNTTTWDLLDVALEAEGQGFEFEIKPWSRWQEFPDLKSLRNGGATQAFEVTLRRKQGVPDGDYDVTFRLLNLQNRPVTTAPLSMLTKKPIEVKRAKVTVDGKIEESEWGHARLCTALCNYRQIEAYDEINSKVPGYEMAKIQTRLRPATDGNHFYFALDFVETPPCASDKVFIYLAPHLDAVPLIIEVDRLAKTCKATGEGEIAFASDEAGRVFEIAVPGKLLGTEKPGDFLLNFARLIDPQGKVGVAPRVVRLRYVHDNPNSAFEKKIGIRITSADGHVVTTLNLEEILKKPGVTHLTLYMLPDGSVQGTPIPGRFTVDLRDGTVTCSDATADISQVKFRAAEDKKTATLSIPAQLLALPDLNRFLVFAEFSSDEQVSTPAPIRSYWRGNEYSVASPYLYEKFVMVN